MRRSLDAARALAPPRSRTIRPFLFCLTCLSFAQVGGLAKFELPVAPKLESLAYHFATESVRHVAELALPAARSRGPPSTV